MIMHKLLMFIKCCVHHLWLVIYLQSVTLTAKVDISNTGYSDSVAITICHFCLTVNK